MRLVSRSALLLTAALLGGSLVAPPSAAGGMAMCQQPATDRQGVHVAITGACFSPTVLHVRAGERVKWTNLDPFEHTVTGHALSWGSLGKIRQEESVAHVFTEPGVYPYSCILHWGMVGAVVVGEGFTPAAAVPAASEQTPAAAPSHSWSLLVVGTLMVVTAGAVLASRRRARGAPTH
jgi:plastocyanin